MYEPSLSAQVEEFKLSVGSMSVSTAEQQMVRSIYFFCSSICHFKKQCTFPFFLLHVHDVKCVHMQMLRSMMEAQDQLERKYISKKEEHRALEMQNYMGLSRNTGSFDPNR